MSMPLPTIVEALGLTLLHFTWQGVVVAGLYKVVDMTVAGSRPQIRYLAGLVSLTAMVCASCATFAITFHGLALLPQSNSGNLIFARRPLTALVLPCLDAVWLLGVAILSMRLFRDIWRIHRLSLAARPAPVLVQNIFAKALMRSHVTQKTYIRIHKFITEPFVVGVFRSVIYLPLSAATALSPEQLEAVLAHELEHVRRADYAWNLLQTVMETLFFYHPAVWWIGGKIREYRELCCDDAALAACNDPLVYATALLSLAEQMRSVPSLGMALGGISSSPSLVGRVGRMLGEAQPETRGRDRRNPVAIAGLAGMVILCLITVSLNGSTRSVAHTVSAIIPQPRVTALIRAVMVVERHRMVFTRPMPKVSSMPKAVAAPTSDASPSVEPEPRVVGAEVSGNQVVYTVTGPPRGALLTRLLPVPASAFKSTAQDDRTKFTYKITYVAPKVIVSEAYPRGTTSLDPDQNYRVVVTQIPNNTAYQVSDAAIIQVMAKRNDKPVVNAPQRARQDGRAEPVSSTPTPQKAVVRLAVVTQQPWLKEIFFNGNPPVEYSQQDIDAGNIRYHCVSLTCDLLVNNTGWNR